MTDMLIDGIISKEEYDAKSNDFARKLHTLESRKNLGRLLVMKVKPHTMWFHKKCIH